MCFLSLSFPALIISEYIESNARTKSATDMLTLCFSILHISGPGYNAWLSRSTFAIRSTSSSFGFGLFPTYHEARLSGEFLFLIQVKTHAKLKVKHLDPYSGAKRRHLFFGLMRVFREFGCYKLKFITEYLILMIGVEYMILSVCLIGQILAAFAGPIGINRLLKSVITIICGSDFLFNIVSVTWKPAVQKPLFSHGSGSFGSLLGQSSGLCAISGISLL